MADEWADFRQSVGDEWGGFRAQPQRSFGEKLSNFARNVYNNPPPTISGIAQDIKNAPQSAATLALGDPTQEEAHAAAGNVFRLAPPLTSAGAAARMGMTAGRVAPLPPPPARPTVTLPEVGAAAEAGYKGARTDALAAPISKDTFGALRTDLEETLHAAGERANVQPVYDEISKHIPSKAGDVQDLANLRLGLRHMRGEDAKAADLILPKVEAAIPPEIMQQIKIADANYGPAKVGQRFDARLAKKEMQAAGHHTSALGDKFRAAATEELNAPSGRFLHPQDQAALRELNAGTTGQDLMRFAWKFGGALPHSIGAAATLTTGNPLMSALPFASMGMRAAYNRSVVNQARATQAAMLQRSPLYMQRMADHAATVAAHQREMAAQAEMNAARQGLLGRAAAPSLLGAQQQPLLPAPQ